ncbi:MAG: hypothetical protein CMJ31_09280 [Phycisphaerae bacterium]|nr:hypothetical protein [Phycisphaerae bacterium]
MSFLHPAILAAGFASMALPIAIHFLFRRRRRPIPWAAMRFLQEAVRKQRHRLQLEQFLLLTLRCLILLFLALGLARPLFGAASAASATAPRDLLIVIDNSIISALRPNDTTSSPIGASTGAPELQRSLDEAAALIDALDPARGDRVSIATLARPATLLIDRATPAATALRAAMTQLSPADAAPDWPAAAALADAWSASLEDTRRPSLAVLSSFRAAVRPAQSPLPAVSQATRDARLAATRPATTQAANVALVSVEPVRAVATTTDRTGLGAQVRLTLRRDGPVQALDQAITRVRLHTSDRLETQAASATTSGQTPTQPPAQASIVWEAGQSTAAVTLTTALANTTAQRTSVLYRAEILSDDDRLPADDRRLALAERRGELRVGLVARARAALGADGPVAPAEWIELALSPARESDLTIVRVEPAELSPARLSALDALVIVEPNAIRRGAWREIATHAARGRPLLITADPTSSVQTWTDAALPALGLEGAADPEATTHEPPLRLRPAEPDALGPLAMLAGELTDLAAPVSIARSLRLDLENAPAPLTLASGDPLVVTTQKDGLIAILTVAPSLEWSDLPSRPLFVPLIQELVRQGVSAGSPSRSVIAGATITPPPGAAELANTTSAEAITVAPDQPVAITSSGVWEALDDTASPLATYVANPDASATDPTPTPRDEVARWLAPWTDINPDAPPGTNATARIDWLGAGDPTDDRATTTAASARDDDRFDWPLLVLAGILAAFEAFFARVASHAGRDTAPAAKAAGARA